MTKREALLARIREADLSNPEPWVQRIHDDAGFLVWMESHVKYATDEQIEEYHALLP